MYKLKLTPISMARSEPSRSMMLQLRMFLLYFPANLLPPAPPIFWSALPFTFRRLKNLSILPVTCSSGLSRILFWCLMGPPWVQAQPQPSPDNPVCEAGHFHTGAITFSLWPDCDCSVVVWWPQWWQEAGSLLTGW